MTNTPAEHPSPSLSYATALDSTQAMPSTIVKQSKEYPATFHFAVLAGFLLPFTLVPYLLIRRQTSSLHRRLDALDHHISVLQRTSKMSSLEHALRKEEVAQALTRAERSKRDFVHLRQELDAIRSQNEATSKSTQGALSDIVEEQAVIRERLNVLPQIGTSLADIAAYVHTAELRQGSPSSPASDRAVERLRSTALQLHKQGRAASE